MAWHPTNPTAHQKDDQMPDPTHSEPDVWIIEVLNDRFQQHHSRCGVWPVRWPVTLEEFQQVHDALPRHLWLQNAEQARQGYNNLLVRNVAVYPKSLGEDTWAGGRPQPNASVNPESTDER